jgi:hypothetical protein
VLPLDALFLPATDASAFAFDRDVLDAHAASGNQFQAASFGAELDAFGLVFPRNAGFFHDGDGVFDTDFFEFDADFFGFGLLTEASDEEESSEESEKLFHGLDLRCGVFSTFEARFRKSMTSLFL